MARHDDVFKHFEIDATKVERLIEMWKFFHPKDEPQPLTPHSLYVNDKYPDVSTHQFMEVLKYKVYDESVVRIDRWQVRAMNIRTEDPVDLMYERFIEVKSGGVDKPKKKAVDEIEEEEASAPAKDKKEKKERKPRKK
jgi:hypothetical protein